MTEDVFEYDAAVSFAHEDRVVADELVNLLQHQGLTVFRDEYTTSQPWGNDVLDHFVNLYARKARYCLVLVSAHYPLKQWNRDDRARAQERAFRDADEFILPIQVDDSQVNGIAEASGYRDLRRDSLEAIAGDLREALARTKPESSPPAKSHDLRSGNVPSSDRHLDH